jgi:tRNA(adenine34) deaminase
MSAVDDIAAMRLAIEEAQHAAAHDDVPIGAVVLSRDGEVIGRGRNRREIDGDPTAHAEILALREAGATLRSWRLDGCTLVVTLEPCAMCAAAAVQARLGRLVFGAPDPKAGAVVSLFELCDDQRLNHRVPWTAGVLRERSEELLRAFFEARRGG